MPDVTFGPRSTTWWGTVGFMITEGLSLVICAFAYLYLRKNFYHYPPLGTPLPSLGIPIIQLVVMGISIVPMWLAARRALQLDISGARIALLAAFIIKLGILVLRWYEFQALNTHWNTDAYGSAAWIVMGFHTTMVVVDSSGTMKAFLRDDQTGPHTINLAQDKAYTALTLANRFATSLNFSKARGGTLGTAMPNVRGLTTVGGGVPIKYHGEVIGAVA